MPDSVPTLILDLSTSDIPDAIARITAFVLQHQYAFRQTIQPEPHTEIDIFPSNPMTSEPHIQVSLRVAVSTPGKPFIQWPTEAAPVPPKTAALLQHLLEICIASEAH